MEPDNFRSNKQLPTPEPKSLDPSIPKVMTVAPEETMPGGGGVSHAIHDDHVLPQETESAIKSSIDSSISSLEEAVGKTGGSGISSLFPSEKEGQKSSGSSSKAGESQSGEYKDSQEPLNGEEKRGAWILGGIVAAGLFFGGGKKEKKAKKGKDSDNHEQK